MLKSLFSRRAAPIDVAESLRQAVRLHQQGRLDEAEPLYRSILDVQPEHFDARHLLGVIRLQQRRPDEAHALIMRALDVRPDSPDALSNVGLALQGLNRHSEAVASYDRAIELKPDYADALFNRGNALLALGRYGEALASYDKAVHYRPEHAGAWGHRGNALAAIERLDEAMTSYERALSLRPESPEVLNTFGNALAASGRFEEAIARYDRALELRPDYADVLNNRGNALHALHRNAEAIDDYRKALRIVPLADAQYNLGIALHASNRSDEALEAYQQALALRPSYLEARHNLANLLNDRGRREEALVHFEQVLAADPRFNYVIGDVVHTQAHLCDWRNRDRSVRQLLEGVRAGRSAGVPGTVLDVADDPAAQLICAKAYALDKYPAAPRPLWNGERYDHDRIRVGYVSRDFHQHPVAALVVELFERHDRSRFEIVGYSFAPDSDSTLRSRIMAGFDRAVDIRGLTDIEAARLMRNAEIDIVVDLMAYTKDARTGIFAQRPAPIQVNYLGYPGTMGASYIDYIIADHFLIRPEDSAHYSEQVVRLPDTYQPNDTKRSIATEAPTRTASGLPDHGFVFCCFNNNYKITPEVFDVWMRLLKRVDGSVLWLLECDPVAKENLRREAVARGVDAQRLVFAPRVRMEQHLARHRLADVFVDTTPYNAHTTTSDALWAGLPVVTCAGKSFASRVAGSLLNAAGLPRLVTESLPDYEALALDLVGKPERLRDMKDHLARTHSTARLFDIERYRRHVESAYRTMYEAQRRGDPAASFDVEPQDA